MSKKIVVITGSPRKDGNSFAMTEAFIKAAEAKGHSVIRFDAAMKNWAAATPVKPASRPEKPVPLTMTLTPLPRPFWKRTLWYLQPLSTGIPSQRKLNVSSTESFLLSWEAKTFQARNAP